jgi:hypothetical protein
MIVEAAKLDVSHYTVQYELLRSQVIGPARNATQEDTAAGQPRGVGLALLLSEGMSGWVKTVETVLRAAPAPRAANSGDPPPREASPQSSAAPVWLSSVQRHEATTLLASLVLSTRPVAHFSSKEEHRSW